MHTYLNDSVLENLQFTFNENGVGPFTGLASNGRAMLVVCNRQFASRNNAFELSSQVREFSKLVVRGNDYVWDRKLVGEFADERLAKHFAFDLGTAKSKNAVNGCITETLISMFIGHERTVEQVPSALRGDGKDNSRRGGKSQKCSCKGEFHNVGGLVVTEELKNNGRLEPRSRMLTCFYTQGGVRTLYYIS